MTVKRSRGGVVERETLRGGEILVKSQYLVREGDFLVSKRQIVHGACGLVPASLDGSVVSNEYAVFRTTEFLDPHFLNYLSSTIYFQQTCFHSSVGVHVEKMIFKVPRWLDFDVHIPPIEEQTKIVSILSAWDGAIDVTEQLIANTLAEKRGLMAHLFRPNADLLEQFGGYQSLTFGDAVHVDVISLGVTTPKDFIFRYISLSDVTPGRISKSLSKYRFDEAPSRARRVLQVGDILMSTVRPNLQGHARVTKDYADCIASTGFCVLTAKDGFNADYLYHYLFSSHVKAQIEALVAGSNYPAINSKDVKQISVLCPAYESQKRISEVLNGVDDLLEALHARVNTLKRERQALMQQLLTGKRRLGLSEVANG